MEDSTNNIEIAAEITAAYVSNNSVRIADLPGLFAEIHAEPVRITSGMGVVVAPEAPTPAVSLKKSITNTHLVCLEHGQSFKS